MMRTYDEAKKMVLDLQKKLAAWIFAYWPHGSCQIRSFFAA